MDVEKIVEEAYKLYMPQDRYEITELAAFISEQMTFNIEEVSMGRRGMEVPSPYNVLEIGTKFGGTFYIWNMLVKQHGAGHCISIDMSDGGIHGGISDEDMDKRDVWFTERFSNCHFIRGDSHSSSVLEELTTLLKGYTGYNSKIELYKHEYFDFLFIDGDHTYEGVKQDFEMYSPFVKKNGIICFHDINDTKRHRDRNVFVGKFWNEIKDSPNYDAVEFNSNLDWAGIGLLVKK
jgi:cephalosporin hydroxylase